MITRAQCGWCGHRLPGKPSGEPGPAKTYCNGECRNEARNRDQRAMTAARGPRKQMAIGGPMIAESRFLAAFLTLWAAG